jgi:hypothetical protein
MTAYGMTVSSFRCRQRQLITANRLPFYIYNINNNNIQNDVVLVCLIFGFHFQFNEIDLYSSKNNNIIILKHCCTLKSSNYLEKYPKLSKICPKKKLKECQKHQNWLEMSISKIRLCGVVMSFNNR